jgi:hypothetical protein
MRVFSGVLVMYCAKRQHIDSFFVRTYLPTNPGQAMIDIKTRVPLLDDRVEYLPEQKRQAYRDSVRQTYDELTPKGKDMFRLVLLLRQRKAVASRAELSIHLHTREALLPCHLALLRELIARRLIVARRYRRPSGRGYHFVYEVPLNVVWAIRQRT